jgi:hypothetical protein
MVAGHYHSASIVIIDTVNNNKIPVSPRSRGGGSPGAQRSLRDRGDDQGVREAHPPGQDAEAAPHTGTPRPHLLPDDQDVGPARGFPRRDWDQVRED